MKFIWRKRGGLPGALLGVSPDRHRICAEPARSGAGKNSYVKFISSATYTGIKISFYKRLSCTYLVIFLDALTLLDFKLPEKIPFTYIKIDLDVYLDEVQYEQLFLYLRFLIAVFCGSRKINTKDLESHLAPWVHFRIRTDRCLKRIVLWLLSLYRTWQRRLEG